MPLIAILDDRPDTRDSYVRLAMLLADDIEVAAFDDPRRMLDWTPTHPVDLVIADFKTENFDGADVTRLFRAMPDQGDVPVVVITAFADRHYRLRALDAGATDFLLSPVDQAEFITRGRSLLRMQHQQRIIQARNRSLERELAMSERTREQLLRDSREALAQVIMAVQY